MSINKAWINSLKKVKLKDEVLLYGAGCNDYCLQPTPNNNTAMIKSLLIIICLAPINLCSQEYIKLNLSARNAKEADKFDYYSMLSTNAVIDSSINIFTKAGLERDEGIEYYNYSGSVKIKYGKIEYTKDSELKIEYLGVSVFYPVKPWLNIGYDYLHQDIDYHLIKVDISYKWLKIDVSGFETIEKLLVNINPEYSINDVLNIGLETNILYISDKLKWNTGVTFKYKPNQKP